MADEISSFPSFPQLADLKDCRAFVENEVLKLKTQMASASEDEAALDAAMTAIANRIALSIIT